MFPLASRAMADTSYLRYTVEPFVREVLSERYGRRFASQVLELGPGGTHEFDAVSDDRSVVAAVKTASGFTRTGRTPSGKIKDCVAELYYLSIVEADERILVLTSPEFFGIFTKTMSGRIAGGIDVQLIELPGDMQAEVDRIKATASAEVSPSAEDHP